MIFALPKRIMAERLSTVPTEFRRPHPGFTTRHLGDTFDCYIEGAAVDRAGNVLMVDIPASRVLKLSPRGEWSIVAEYDGRPKGLKVHRDGRLFIADNRRGVVIVDPATGKTDIALTRSSYGGFQACNDIALSRTGSVLFTDQAASCLSEPNGSVYRWRPDGPVERLVNNAPGPNGVCYNPSETQIYVAVTRANAIWTLWLNSDGTRDKLMLFVQMSGGIGPDGLVVDEQGGLIVAHLGIGVWRFDGRGRATHFIETPGGDLCSSVSFGSGDSRTLYITEAASGSIYQVEMPYKGAT